MPATDIHQIIPAEHIPSLLSRGHYFIPCHQFRDEMEFRYGYAYFEGGLNTFSDSDPDFQAAFRRTFTDQKVNDRINSIAVSCWTMESNPSPKMWKEYGAGGPAIRLSVNGDRFVNHVRSKVGKVGWGEIDYGSQFHPLGPQFPNYQEIEDSSEWFAHLFFYKRPLFKWENEFRILLRSVEPVCVPLRSDVITRVTVSPLKPLDPALEATVRNEFGDLVG